MPSTSTPSRRASASARRATASRPAQWLARLGLTARGILYLLIGVVAILVAIGQRKQEADQAGALQLVASQPFGLVLLWLLFTGFAGYAVWLLSEAAFGMAGERPGAGPRLKCVARALVYAGFAVLTLKVITGKQASETSEDKDLTAAVMHHTGGRWLVGTAGLVIVIAGLALVAQGIRRTFMKQLRTGEMSPRARRTVQRLGMIGSTARGAVFALAGVLVIDAAVQFQPAKAGGLDKALLTLRDQPFGGWLLVLAALGLIAFGLYGLAEARWRQV